MPTKLADGLGLRDVLLYRFPNQKLHSNLAIFNFGLLNLWRFAPKIGSSAPATRFVRSRNTGLGLTFLVNFTYIITTL